MSFPSQTIPTTVIVIFRDLMFFFFFCGHFAITCKHSHTASEKESVTREMQYENTMHTEQQLQLCTDICINMYRDESESLTSRVKCVNMY